MKVLQCYIANCNMQYSLWREFYELEEDLSVTQLHKFDVLWVVYEDNHGLSKERSPEKSGK